MSTLSWLTILSMEYLADQHIPDLQRGITIAVLVGFNFLLQRIWSRFAMKGRTIDHLCHAISCFGHRWSRHDADMVPTIPNGFWFTTPENEWEQIFWRYLPPWLTSRNLSSLEHFYVGETIFYDRTYFNDWLRPIVWWTLLLTTLIWVMVCLDLSLRKQWIERERLSYPIVKLPLEMVRPEAVFFDPG